MKKFKIIPLLIAAVLAAAPLCGCSKNNTEQSQTSYNDKLEGIAEHEFKADIAEEVSGNETTFKLNSVIDSGMTEENGGRYFYLDAVIGNPTEKSYDLNILNNFYLLFPDKTEAHFDVRTQIYAGKNIENYIESPFTLTPNGEISGIIGGFIVPPGINEFTVCFFPSQDMENDKSNVIKVDVSASDIITLPKPQQ